MEDSEIVGSYFKRDEKAVTETAAKYGAFCHSIALSILSVNEDAQECVNDTYMRARSSIPPQKPEKLGVWLGRAGRFSVGDHVTVTCNVEPATAYNI